jgi:hypothetical protein
LHSKLSKLAIAGALAAALLSHQANAADITFDSFPPGEYSTQTTFFDAGYKLVYTPVDPYGPNRFPHGFAIVGEPPVTIACGPTPCSTDRTNAFYSNNSGYLTVSARNGEPFSISALDVAQVFTKLNWILDFTVIGMTESHLSVSQEFVTAPGGGDSFHTFTITNPGFDDLASVIIAGIGHYPTVEFAVDNIVVNGSAVPEPASWAMLFIGFAGFGVTSYRNAKIRPTAPSSA